MPPRIRGPTGRFVPLPSAAGERARAFLPAPLPPDPPVRLTPERQHLLDQANQALGRLDAVSALLPDAGLFLYTYLRQEAVLSSAIEGTQSSLSDLLLFEIGGAPSVPAADAREVLNYVAAMERGLAEVRKGAPLHNRLLCELHALLLRSGRGSEKAAGEFRRTQNWVGGTRPGNAAYVPPPADRVAEAMGDLQRFLHDRPAPTPTLLKAALAHVQFESIHPFLDGNGRLGRLLITLLLCAEGVLREPLLYVSLHLKRHRQTYYELLQRVRQTGDWEAWVDFFATGVRETAEGAVRTAQALGALVEADANRIGTIGRGAGSALRVHLALRRRPILSISGLRQATRLSVPAITNALRALERLGIVRERTGRRRDRVWGYERYLGLLAEGVEGA